MGGPKSFGDSSTEANKLSEGQRQLENTAKEKVMSSIADSEAYKKAPPVMQQAIQKDPLAALDAIKQLNKYGVRYVAERLADIAGMGGFDYRREKTVAETQMYLLQKSDNGIMNADSLVRLAYNTQLDYFADRAVNARTEEERKYAMKRGKEIEEEAVKLGLIKAGEFDRALERAKAPPSSTPTLGNRTGMETALRMQQMELAASLVSQILKNDGRGERSGDEKELKEKIGDENFSKIEKDVSQMVADGASAETIQVAVYDMLNGMEMPKPVTAKGSPLANKPGKKN
jgi:hypothetical protein